MRSCHEIVGALSVDLSDNVNMIWGYRLDPDMGNAVKAVMIVSAIPDGEDLNINELKEEASLGIPMVN